MKLYSCSEISWIWGQSPRPPIGETAVFTVDWEAQFWRERGVQAAGMTPGDLQKIAEEIIRRESFIQRFPQWWEVYMDFYHFFLEAGRSPYGATAAALKIVLDLITKHPYPALVPLTAAQILSVAAAAAVTLVIVIYVFNPQKVFRVVRSYKGGRYVMGMQENMWWADMVGETPSGRTIYTLCWPVGGFAEETERYVAREDETGPDTIYFHGTWRESWYDFPLWYQKQFESIQVGFVGLCWGLGGGLYVLRLAHEDEYVEEIGEIKEETERRTCQEPEYEDKEVTVSWM